MDFGLDCNFATNTHTRVSRSMECIQMLIPQWESDCENAQSAIYMSRRHDLLNFPPTACLSHCSARSDNVPIRCDPRRFACVWERLCVPMSSTHHPSLFSHTQTNQNWLRPAAISCGGFRGAHEIIANFENRSANIGSVIPNTAAAAEQILLPHLCRVCTSAHM